MNWLKENWFRLGILIAVFSLAYSFYYAHHIAEPNETPETSNEIKNSSDNKIIPPNQTLKIAFDESQHSAIVDIAELSCFPTSRYDCDLKGCKPAEPATYYFVDYGTESGTYFRCDPKGCDPYPVKVTSSGSFTQFTPLLGQAMLFKVTNDDPLVNKGEFVDVATLGTVTLVSFGKCEELK